jgi:hypothetical protein
MLRKPRGKGFYQCYFFMGLSPELQAFLTLWSGEVTDHMRQFSTRCDRSATLARLW